MLLLGNNNRELSPTSYRTGASFQVKDQGDKITLSRLALYPESSGAYAQPAVVVNGLLEYTDTNLMISANEWVEGDVILCAGRSKLMLSVHQHTVEGNTEPVTTQIILMVAGDNRMFFPLKTLVIKHTEDISFDGGYLSNTSVVELPGCLKIVPIYKTINGNSQISWGYS